MGAPLGTLKRALTSQQGLQKCVPNQPYRPFEEQLHATGDGGLVLQLRALPQALARREVAEDTFWWVDAQFLPYNDAQLLVTASAYTPRVANSWVPVEGVPRGRVLLLDTDYLPVKGHVMKGTECPVFPKIQPHPLGVAFTYAGLAKVRVDSLTNEVLYSRPRDMDNRSQRFCAVSPNGGFLAVLSRSSFIFFVEIFRLDCVFVSLQPALPCHKLCPGFVATVYHNDHVECKWSPDGSYVAVSSSQGQLFLLNKSTGKNDVTIFPDLVTGQISTAGSFDFDPRVQHSVMAVGSCDGVLSIVQLDTIVQSGAVVQEMDTGGTIDCVQYNQDGSNVAASFRTFEVRLYNTQDLSTHHVIDMSELCPRHVSVYQDQAYPTVNRLSFSYDGRHLATSSCDGCVRVWAVPRLLTLQQWCRKRILQHIPISLIRKTDLPQKLKRFLLSEVF